MKRVAVLLCAALVAASVVAEPAKPELTPAQKANVANGLTAVVVGPVALPAALLSGKAEALCNALGGTYTPNSEGKDHCPGGVWLRIISLL